MSLVISASDRIGCQVVEAGMGCLRKSIGMPENPVRDSFYPMRVQKVRSAR